MITYAIKENPAMAKQISRLLSTRFTRSLWADPVGNYLFANDRLYSPEYSFPHCMAKNALNNSNGRELSGLVKEIFEQYTYHNLGYTPDINTLIGKICDLLAQKTAEPDTKDVSSIVKSIYLRNNANRSSLWSVMRESYVSHLSHALRSFRSSIDGGYSRHIYKVFADYHWDHSRHQLLTYAQCWRNNGIDKCFEKHFIVEHASANFFCLSTIDALASLYAKETTFYHSIRAIANLMEKTVIDYRIDANRPMDASMHVISHASLTAAQRSLSWFVRQRALGERMLLDNTTPLDWNQSQAQSEVTQRQFQLAMLQLCLTANIVLQLFSKGVKHIRSLEKAHYAQQ